MSLMAHKDDGIYYRSGIVFILFMYVILKPFKKYANVTFIDIIQRPYYHIIKTANNARNLTRNTKFPY